MVFPCQKDHFNEFLFYSWGDALDLYGLLGCDFLTLREPQMHFPQSCLRWPDRGLLQRLTELLICNTKWGFVYPFPLS